MSLISRLSDTQSGTVLSEKTKQRFSQFLDRSYTFDESVGDMVIHSLEDMSKERWDREVEEDRKNYDPSGTTEERINENREWALNMARKRAEEAGYKLSPDTQQESTSTKKTVIFPKVPPPPTEPLPRIDEKDFEAVSHSTFDPRELGLVPPPLPRQLIDLVPFSRPDVGIAEGIVIDGTYEEGWESCDSETMVVSCINTHCDSYLHCPRGASLVRCGGCNTVCPACPGRGRNAHDDMTELSGNSWKGIRRSSSDTNDAVRGPEPRSRGNRNTVMSDISATTLSTSDTYEAARGSEPRRRERNTVLSNNTVSTCSTGLDSSDTDAAVAFGVE
jgi:LSD1 subclass zinc finger protein